MFLDTLESITVRDIQDGYVLHCEECDFRNAEPDGNPSIRAFNRLPEMLLYCWCNTTSVIRHEVDYVGFNQGDINVRRPDITTDGHERYRHLRLIPATQIYVDQGHYRRD